MIEELLEVFLQGAQAQPQQSTQQGAPASPWMDLIEDVLGGQQTGGQQAGGQQAGGQRAGPQAGVASLGMDDILGMVLGGGSKGAVGGNPLLAPFTNMLSEKLGISPQMASVIVSAAFGMLMGKMGGSGGGAASPKDMANGLNLDDLLDGDFLKKNGVTEKVAKQTGMDPQEAEDSLLKALEMLGLQKGKKVQPTSQQKAAPKAAKAKPKTVAKKSSTRKKSGDMQHLLDEWKVHG